jgi:ketosteroid isomerase-like protein
MPAAMIAKRFDPESASEVIEEFYVVFRRGDLAEMQRLVATDLMLHVPGKSSLAGTHRGVGEFIALTTHAANRFIPSTLKLISIEEGEEDNTATALIEVAVRAVDGTTTTVRLRQTFHFDEDLKVSEAWLKPEDQRRLDRLVR